MYNELLIKIGSEDHRAFLKDGFYSSTVGKAPLHKHNYAEVHIVAAGNVVFHIGEMFYESAGGNLVVIPPNIFHYVEKKNDDVCHTAFQVDYDICSLITQKISEQTAQDFIREIEKSRKTSNYAVVATYISLFCNCFCREPLSIHPSCDYKFLIREFFYKHYHKKLHLQDLAKELHLSERQTERLVIKNTGHTFSEELTSVRMSVASYLLKTTTLSKEDIARRVGFQSYVGFWKAMKQYTSRNCVK